MAETEQKTLRALMLINFIGAFGYSIVFPFLIVVVTGWGGNEIVYGFVGAAYAAFQFIGAPWLGRLSDRIGRRAILVISQIGTFAAWAVFLTAFALPDAPLFEVTSTLLGSFALTLPLLFIILARALDGLTGGNVSVANAMVADISSEETRSANYGRMGMASNTGTVMGPAIAGLFGAFAVGPIVPVTLALIISGLAIWAVLQIPRVPKQDCPLPERCHSRSLGREMRNVIKPANHMRLGELLRVPVIRLLLGIYFLAFLAFSTFFVSFPVLALGRLYWGTFELGLYFAALSLLGIVVQGPVLARLSKRFDEAHLMLAGSLSLATGFLLFIFATPVTVIAAMPFFALGNGITWPSYTACLSKVAPGGDQGAVQGASSSVGSLASIVGLSAGGLGYAVLGTQFFWLAFAAMIVIASLIAGYVRRVARSEKIASAGEAA